MNSAGFAHDGIDCGIREGRRSFGVAVREKMRAARAALQRISAARENAA
ncbi:MAG: hypothetical protein VB099_09615 [Candidatus Limiplasma sp.]|nr:hypothetical protein [Candidatus Limiplasma sp.]